MTSHKTALITGACINTGVAIVEKFVTFINVAAPAPEHVAAYIRHQLHSLWGTADITAVVHILGNPVRAFAYYIFTVDDEVEAVFAIFDNILSYEFYGAYTYRSFVCGYGLSV